VDLGCGNGQASIALADYFGNVSGVDPSRAQIDNAARHPKITYTCAPAEATGLPSGEADLISVAQAFHWFKTPAIYGEFRRLVKPKGLIALWCYGLNQVSPDVDAVFWRLYHDYLDAYWEPERRLVESGYKNVPLPFDEIPAPACDMRGAWTLRQMLGYLGTWSPLKRFRSERNFDPLEKVAPDLEKAWGTAAKREVTWPLSVRAFSA